MTRRAAPALLVLAAIAGAPTGAAASHPCALVSVTKLEFRRAPVAGRSAVLLFTASDPDGRIWSFDVRWGDGQRDHFTVAPAYRKARVTRRFGHVYRRRGSHTLTARARSLSPCPDAAHEDTSVKREDSAPRRLRVRVR
jgi:hypothetical protein